MPIELPMNLAEQNRNLADRHEEKAIRDLIAALDARIGHIQRCEQTREGGYLFAVALCSLHADIARYLYFVAQADALRAGALLYEVTQWTNDDRRARQIVEKIAPFRGVFPPGKARIMLTPDGD